MGAPEKQVDVDTLYDLLNSGKNQKQVAAELDISVPTLARRIADITDKQGLILKYRELQNLQLTSIQARILEAITPDKIAGASLGELVAAFRILKDKELVSLGQPDKIMGLVGYLIHIEKEEAIKNNPPLDITQYAQLEEAEELVHDINSDTYIPKI
jgi:hypothetical protein